MEITKINNGYKFQNIEFNFTQDAEKLSNKQAHFITDKGVILIDTDVVIDNKTFTDIDSIINYFK